MNSTENKNVCKFGSNKNTRKNDNNQKKKEAAQLISSFKDDTIVCFTDGSCDPNPGPCGAATVVCFPSMRNDTNNSNNIARTLKGRAKLLSLAQVNDTRVGEWRIEKRSLGQGTNNIGELTAIEMAIDIIFKVLIEQSEQRERKAKTIKQETRPRNKTELAIKDDVDDSHDDNDGKSNSDCNNDLNSNDKNNIIDPDIDLKIDDQIDWSKCPIEILTDSNYAVGCLTLNWNPKVNKELIFNIKAKLEMLRNAVNCERGPSELDVKCNRSVNIRWVKAHAGIAGNEYCDRLAAQAIRESINNNREEV